MNFDKAHKELLSGKKIRRKEWEPLMHMRIIDGHVKTFKGEYTNFYKDADIITTNGWLVVDGDNIELTFVEAIGQLKAKKQLTHKNWLEEQSDKFIFIDHNRIAMCKSVEFEFMPTWECLNSDDWQIMK
jgi:hypothetical protein